MNRVERRLFIGLALLAIVMISRGSQAMHGDASYHLAISASIVDDADLDLSDQFDPAGGFIFRRDLSAGFALPGREGALYPSQGIGLGLLLAPVFVTARTVASVLPESLLTAVRWDRARSARDLISTALALLAAWVGVLVLRLSRRVAGASAPHLVATLIACGTLPFVGTSILALSEVPAAWLTVWFTLDMLESRHPVRRRLVLSLLPWLHARYVVIVLAGLVWELARSRTDRERSGRLVRVALWPVLSLVLLGIAQLAMFGTLVPAESAVAHAPIATRLWTTVTGLAGVWLDADFGLLLVAPFWVFAIAGVGRLRSSGSGYVRFAVLSLVGLIVVAAWTDAWRPAGAPGLVLLPALLVLAPCLAEGFAGRRLAGRAVVAATVAWALVSAVLVIGRPARVWTQDQQGVGRVPAAALVRLATFGTAERRLARRGLALEPNALATSAAEGDLEAVHLFLRAGVAPAVALEAAARAGRAEVIEALLAAGPQAGPEWTRALVAAEVAGYQSVAERLRSAGASMDTTDARGYTALIEAAQGDALDNTRDLVDRGANVNQATLTGRTALFFATRAGDDALIDLLLQAGADINATDVDGWTPLMAAVRAGRPVIVDLLIARGASVGAMSRLGWTPLMLAAFDGQLPMVEALVAAGADVNVYGTGGLTALVRAAERGDVDIARVLVAAGATPDTPIAGYDAATWARLNHRMDVAALLEGGQ